MANVTLSGVSKTYEENIVAAEDINLDIPDKEFIVIVGPSGCGKTTILRLIAGLEDLTKGEIMLDGKVINKIPPKDRDIAMVFQNYSLYPHMTVRKNLEFGLMIRKKDKSEIAKRVQETASILGIENILDRYPKQLSNGEQQRVAVGRAIIRNPKVFLFDEPLSSLDTRLRVQMRAEINRLHTRLQTTMIYVTHDQIEAMTMGDRIVVMKDGVVQQIDDPMTLYNQPLNKFVAEFIGSVSMNFFELEIQKEKDKIFLIGENIKIALLEEYTKRLKNYKSDKIILGIRAEDIYQDGRTPAKMKFSLPIPSVIDVIEPIGYEKAVYFSSGIHTFIAKFSPDYKIKVNQNMNVVLDLNKIKLFDIETEKRLF